MAGGSLAQILTLSSPAAPKAQPRWTLAVRRMTLVSGCSRGGGPTEPKAEAVCRQIPGLAVRNASQRDSVPEPKAEALRPAPTMFAARKHTLQQPFRECKFGCYALHQLWIPFQRAQSRLFSPSVPHSVRDTGGPRV